MNAILGYAQVLERDPTLRASHRESMQTVLSSGNHLLELIDDVLEISKIEAGKVTPSLVMLNKIVTALNRDLGSFFGLQIDTHKLVQRPEDRMVVTGDALRGGKGVTYERLVPLAAGNLLEANTRGGTRRREIRPHHPSGRSGRLSHLRRNRSYHRRRGVSR